MFSEQKQRSKAHFLIVTEYNQVTESLIFGFVCTNSSVGFVVCIFRTTDAKYVMLCVNH